ncbi:hypothetical protein OIV83_004820 [Microbotryomycetes sp. JL201]|nr:hypothetical protein OIV83_004820 [Microbotryomycetes sp. JL201]
MAASATNSIHVLALEPLDVVDAHTFVCGLVDVLSELANCPESDSKLADDSQSSVVAVPWTISNKYYRAETTFRIKSATAVDTGTLRQEQVVVVLAERTLSPGQPIARMLDSLKDNQFEVALLVTISPRQMTNREDAELDQTNNDEWDDLALEHGFEWVDVDTRGSVRGQGIDRVIEALQANMWDDMKIFEQPKKQAAFGKEQGPTMAEEVDQDEGDSRGEFEAEYGQLRLPTAKDYVPLKVEFPASYLPNLNRNRHAKSPDNSNLTSPARGSNRLDALPSTAGFEDDFAPFVSAADSQLRGFTDGEDDEIEIDQFESILNKLQAMRVETQTDLNDRENSSGQTEEEALQARRDRAERMLVQLLGQSSFS